MPVPTTIKDLSSTISANSPAGTDSINDGAGLTADDYFRAHAGIVRAESVNKGWERWNHTPSYISATSFSVPTDLTAIYTVGRRLKTTNTGGTTYSRIFSSVFASVTTLVVVNESGVLDAGLSEVQLGQENKSMPAVMPGFLGYGGSPSFPFHVYDATTGSHQQKMESTNSAGAGGYAAYSNSSAAVFRQWGSTAARANITDIGSLTNNDVAIIANNIEVGRFKSGGGFVTGGTTLAQTAQSQVDSTTKGFLPPRMTTVQRDAIASPAAGLIIFNTTTAKLNVFTTVWESVTSA